MSMGTRVWLAVSIVMLAPVSGCRLRIAKGVTKSEVKVGLIP